MKDVGEGKVCVPEEFYLKIINKSGTMTSQSYNENGYTRLPYDYYFSFLLGLSFDTD